jgi:uncharacterized protein (DUF433 family)
VRLLTSTGLLTWPASAWCTTALAGVAIPIRGLRIRVKDILDLLAAGTTQEEVLEDYPYLEPADIVAALEYAARQSDHPVLSVA